MATKSKLDLKDFRPSEFMRARRPELFSDSEALAESRLTREALEYHLDTLTSRKQETDFEYFARSLAQREVCPNLLPQTGPTGGGDSKVDTETYPVADALSFRWYEGLAREADSERWAFAFSTKKDWRAKVMSDVASIAGTGRGYKKVWFISSRFVRDKARAEVEDKLRKKHKIDVRILDRTWILDRVFKNNRVQLAIETLRLTGYEETKKVVGPRDTERERELEELEKQIEDPERYIGVEYQIVEDCLRAAIVARGLGRPRVDVEGRFARAERIAAQVDSRSQRLRVIYTKAWTVFWWYDDIPEFNRLYDAVEGLAVGSTQAGELELLTNLWHIIHATVRRGQLNADVAKIDARMATLRTELERLESDPARPNNALHARSSRVVIGLALAIARGEGISERLEELKDILVKSDGLASFPAEPLITIIQEMGDVLADNSVYDELVELVVKVVQKRSSTAEAGRVLLERGFQKLRAGKRYDAIRLLGRAQSRLAMYENRGEYVAALGGCGAAYEAAGLLWAARANLLAAANVALAEFSERGIVVRPALSVLQRLVWIELDLGRVPRALAAMDLASGIATHLQLEGRSLERFQKERQTQDMILGLLFLKSDPFSLKWLAFLPHLLDARGLIYSRMALLYALGHEEQLRTEGTIPEIETAESVRDLFSEWVSQPGGSDLPDDAELLVESGVTLRSYVLGCEVLVKTANNRTSMDLAETLLAALEALLATSLGHAIPHRPMLTITIRPSDFVGDVPRITLREDDDATTLEIQHAPAIRYATPKERTELRDWLIAAVANTLSQIAIIDDPEVHLTRLGRDEEGFGRALDVANASVAVGNLFGEPPKISLSDLEADAPPERFPLKRAARWSDGLVMSSVTEKKGNDRALSPASGEPPPELFGVDHLRHRDRKVLSPIDLPLWERAKWGATVFVYPPDSSVPPVLAIGFLDKAAARAIFKRWRAKLGAVDHDEELRISIITGVNKRQPAHYSVVISGNLESQVGEADSSQQWITVCRVHRLTPTTPRNRDGFLAQFDRVGKYLLAPGHFDSPDRAPDVFMDLAIEKRALRVVPAWQLGPNDLDLAGVMEDDDPIIPPTVSDPPIIEARKWRASLRSWRPQ
jgi:hypothetical protein